MENFKILIVDDEPDLLEVCVDAFDMEGFDCVGAENGQKALEMIIADSDIKVIVCDANMPVMGGLELLDKITALDSKYFFFLATGDIEMSDEDIKGKGGVGLLLKPYDIDETIEVIKSLSLSSAA